MTAPSTKQVAAASPGTTGGVLWAPAGTALPTTATATPNVAFVPLGYISDEGISDGSDAASYDDIFAWGGDNIATLQTTGSVQRYSFKLAELYNTDATKFVYGTSNVTVTAAGVGTPTKMAILDKGAEITPCEVIIDIKYLGKKGRIVIPNAVPQVTSRDPLVHTDVAKTEVTITCLKDASGNRQYIYLENDDPN